MSNKRLKTWLLLGLGVIVTGVLCYYLYKRFFKVKEVEKLELENLPTIKQNYSIKKCTYCRLENCGCGANDYK